MRNYVALNLARVWYPDPITQVLTANYLAWGTSLDDVQTKISWLNGQFGNVPGEIDDYGVNYVLLDKANLSCLLTTVGSGFAFNTIGVSAPYFFAKDPQTDEIVPFAPGTNTPRNGWTDSRGVQKTPSPSDSKSKTKTVAAETLLQSLETFAGRLVAAGYKTGTNSILDELVVFIVRLFEKKPVDMPALTILLQTIEARLK